MFKREELTVNGVKTVVYSGGQGKPVVLFHGAGTLTGFDFAAPWTEKFRVIAPYHPGFGESGDDNDLSGLHDYVMHYLDLFDALELETFSLVGLSLGGCLAAKFCSEHGHRVEKLALVSPAGIIDPAHPMLDLLTAPPEQMMGLLSSDRAVLKKFVPDKPDLDFMALRYRESGTVARLLWEHPNDPKFMRHLHRVKNPTLIVWGTEDKIVPVEHATTWRKLVPQADIRTFAGAGHLVLIERPEASDAIVNFLH